LKLIIALIHASLISAKSGNEQCIQNVALEVSVIGYLLYSATIFLREDISLTINYEWTGDKREGGP
jgi:hypothetical protein